MKIFESIIALAMWLVYFGVIAISAVMICSYIGKDIMWYECGLFALMLAIFVELIDMKINNKKR